MKKPQKICPDCGQAERLTQAQRKYIARHADLTEDPKEMAV